MDSTATHWTHAQGLGVMTPIDQNSCPRPPADTNTNNNIINNQNKRSNHPTSTLARPQKDQALNCPRCNSTNTKFCYYNNYSLSQPRYFCKTCRRYWTEGGSLRNVPVGGGSRKNRRPSSSSSSSSSSSTSSKNIIHKLPDDLITKNPTTNTITSSSSTATCENPKLLHQYEASHDLNLAYPPITNLGCSSSTPSSSGLLSLGPFITAMPPTLAAAAHDHHHHHHHHHSNTLYTSTGGLFPLLEFKPTLNFSLDGFDTTGFVTSTQTTSTTATTGAATTIINNNGVSGLEQNKGLGGGSSTGYWNAMFP